MAKRPTCIHLSNHSFPSQSFLGKADPGKTSRKVEMTSQKRAGHTVGFIDFKLFCNNTNSQGFTGRCLQYMKKGAPEEAPCNQL